MGEPLRQSPDPDQAAEFSIESQLKKRLFERLECEVFGSSQAEEEALKAWREDRPTHIVTFSRGTSEYTLTRHVGMDNLHAKGRVLRSTREVDGATVVEELTMYNTGALILRTTVEGLPSLPGVGLAVIEGGNALIDRYRDIE